MAKPGVRKPQKDNFSKTRNEISTLTGITLKKKRSDRSKELSRKEKRKLEKKLKKVKKIAFYSKKSVSDILESEETSKRKEIKKEKKKKKADKEKKIKEEHVQSLKMDDERDDAEIAKLEKLLHIKKDRKTYKKAFYDDGIDTLLDFCDRDKRKDLLKNERNAWFDEGDENENSDGDDENVLEEPIVRSKKKIKKDIKAQKEESMDEEDDDDDDDNLISGDEGENGFDLEDMGDDSDEEMQVDKRAKNGKKVHFDDEDVDGQENESELGSEFEDGDEEDDDKNNVKEDIYGRVRDEKGNIVKSKSSAAELLMKLEEKNLNPANQMKLQKQLNGLFNRLSGSNMHAMVNEMLKLFNSNQFSRFEIINTVFNLLKNSIIRQNVVTAIRLVCEHAALCSILSSNIGNEFGANLLQKLIMTFKELFDDNSAFEIEDKRLDNVVLFLCFLYNFKLFTSVLIFDIMNEKLISSMDNIDKLEKIIELILIVLRQTGFQLRKDNPIALKELIIKLKFDTSKFQNNENISSRLKFMIDSVNAIKNNDVRLMEGYDPDMCEQLYKQVKILFSEQYRNDFQLNINYKDLIKSNEYGKWWIVGSAWSKGEENTDERKTGVQKGSNQFSEKILALARKQHMNTDIRRNIFCIIVSAEDYADAFTKLMKLSLKKQQEREIIYVLVHCVLNEKKYNPYYTLLMQRFCEFDRRFKMTLQFHTWDKFKEMGAMNEKQVTNFSLFFNHLICNKAVTLVILKNLSGGEMNKSILLFLKTLISNVIEKNSEEKLQEIFIPLSMYPKLGMLKNSLKLFIDHFILRNKGKEIEVDPVFKSKCEFAQKLLQTNIS